ncbi:hypothetical protein LR013_00005 [candidate division NPL-UPA2 bacterium]|nr:hypothetical protein [candidate division NPL-UPA2 bacterium]
MRWIWGFQLIANGGHNTYFIEEYFLAAIASLDYVVRKFRSNNSCYPYYKWILVSSSTLVKEISIVSPDLTFS